MTGIAEIIQSAVDCHRAGRFQDAEQLYRLLLQSEANHAGIYTNLGIVLRAQGRLDEAIANYTEAIRLEPESAEAHFNLANALKERGRCAEAVEGYKQAIMLKPDFAEAHYNMANALRTRGRHDEAISNYERAIHLKPDYAKAYNNLGLALRKLGRLTEAIENYRKAIQLKPSYAEAYNNLGIVLKDQEQFAEAIESYKRAIQFKPDYAEAYYNLANAQRNQEQIADTIENYTQAIRLKPDHADAHWNYSHALLSSGRFIEGFREYEWRRHIDLKTIAYPHHHQVPRWDGSCFEGKRLLVHYEQGLGDSLQFVRYLPSVKARAGTVIFESLKPLMGLLRGFDAIDELVETSFDRKPAVKFDLYASLMDLPGIFQTTLETIPADVPYLHADPAKTEYWKNRLTETDFKVGIVWAGSTVHKSDRERSCALECFAPLAEIAGVRLYGLQKGPAAMQMKDLAGKMSITDLAEQFADFTDTAGAIENLDLVISVDTAVVHLAGAMGKPVWVLLQFAPDWRWMLKRTDSPWYPTMRLFRQRKPNDWSNVFGRVADELKKHVDIWRIQANG
ncbi:MAG: tetratricopeptide repeat protein [Planctomycetota bacterium]|jgi:tetratricopeptide (TPR) repeat protein